MLTPTPSRIVIHRRMRVDKATNRIQTKSIWACTCITTLERNGVSINLHPCPNVDTATGIWKQTLRGLTRRSAQARRQHHNQKLKPRVQFGRLSTPKTYNGGSTKCCTSKPVPSRMTVLNQMWPVYPIKRRRIHLTRGGRRARTIRVHSRREIVDQCRPK